MPDASLLAVAAATAAVFVIGPEYDPGRALATEGTAPR